MEKLKMLEMDCVLASFEQEFEIGRTPDIMVNFFKSKNPLSVMEVDLRCIAEHFGLWVSVLGRKEDLSGNILKVRFTCVIPF